MVTLVFQRQFCRTVESCMPPVPGQLYCTVQAVLCLLLYHLNMHIRFRVIVFCCSLKKVFFFRLVFSCHGLKTLCIGGLFHFYVRYCRRVAAYYPCTSDLCDLYHCWSLLLNPLNAELNPICHLLALLGGATIVVVSRLRVKVCHPRCVVN